MSRISERTIHCLPMPLNHQLPCQSAAQLVKYLRYLPITWQQNTNSKTIQCQNC